MGARSERLAGLPPELVSARGINAESLADLTVDELRSLLHARGVYRCRGRRVNLLTRAECVEFLTAAPGAADGELTGAVARAVVESPALAELVADVTRCELRPLLARLSEVRPVHLSFPERPEPVKLPPAARPELLELVENCRLGLPSYLYGPAGSGKSTMARQAAAALGLRFGMLSCSPGTREWHFLGCRRPGPDGAWRYEASEFVSCAEDEAGALFLVDEFDTCEPGAMMPISDFLGSSRGELHLPDRFELPALRRSPGFVFLVAGNVPGHGGSELYSSAQPLDGRTLDRFACCKIFVGYDAGLEESMALGVEHGAAFLAWVRTCRELADKAQLRRTFSTRLVERGCLLLAAGRPMDAIKQAQLRDFTPDELRSLGDAGKVGK